MKFSCCFCVGIYMHNMKVYKLKMDCIITFKHVWYHIIII